MNTIIRVSNAKWARARRQGSAHYRDSRPFLLILDRVTGATVYIPLERDAGGFYYECECAR